MRRTPWAPCDRPRLPQSRLRAAVRAGALCTAGRVRKCTSEFSLPSARGHGSGHGGSVLGAGRADPGGRAEPLTLAQRRWRVPLVRAPGAPPAGGVAAAHEPVPGLAEVLHLAPERPRRPVHDAAVAQGVGQAAVRRCGQGDTDTLGQKEPEQCGPMLSARASPPSVGARCVHPAVV